jgi:DNA processing protein
VETAQDILDELGVQSVSTLKGLKLTGDNSEFLDQIGFDPVGLDTLAERCGLTVSQLSAMLLPLELEGRISAMPGGLYQRIN